MLLCYGVLELLVRKKIVITFLKLWQLLSSLSSSDQFPWTFLWLYYTVVTILHGWQEICKIIGLENDSYLKYEFVYLNISTMSGR